MWEFYIKGILSSLAKLLLIVIFNILAIAFVLEVAIFIIGFVF